MGKRNGKFTEFPEYDRNGDKYLPEEDFDANKFDAMVAAHADELVPIDHTKDVPPPETKRYRERMPEDDMDERIIRRYEELNSEVLDDEPLEIT